MTALIWIAGVQFLFFLSVSPTQDILFQEIRSLINIEEFINTLVKKQNRGWNTHINISIISLVSDHTVPNWTACHAFETKNAYQILSVLYVAKNNIVWKMVL